jgi:hypothetical protein
MSAVSTLPAPGQIDAGQAGAAMSAVSTMPAPGRSTTDKAGATMSTVSTMPAARTSMKRRRPRCPPYQRCRRRAQIDRHCSD